MLPTTTARNASMEEFVEILRQQHDAKLDAVVPASAITSTHGDLHIRGMGFEAQAGLDPNSVGVFRPTPIMDAQLADKLKIPVPYLRRMRDERPDLYDANVNGWLHGHITFGDDGEIVSKADPDARKFLVRTFTNTAGPGIGRALLSDGYGRYDHLDIVTAALTGVKESGAEVDVISCNISEQRMWIRVACPQVWTNAPALLTNYRSPIEPRYRPESLYGGPGSKVGDVVFAGFDIGNSETGGGRVVLTPVVTVLQCTNGMKMTHYAESRQHLGAKMDEGVVTWSADTQRKNLELVTAMARDAVQTFISPEFLTRAVAELSARADVELPNPVDTVQLVAKNLRFSEATTGLVLAHFIRGGQATAGGLMQAMTSAAQTVTDTDIAYDLETQAVQAMSLAAAEAAKVKA